jgi:16S rRNA (guanine527-N7)-methyltransferase
MTLEARIQDGAARMALALPDGAVAKCAAYLRLLEKWNRVHNLTAVRETERMVVLHLLDSFSVLPHIDDALSILDVGSGGGLPGIPIAIARPDLRVTLLDSSTKKATFLEQARAELALTHVEVVCARVEQWHPDQLFDAVVSRAFADLGEFVAQAQHLVAPSGRMLAMKGVYPFEEIARLPATHRVAQVAELHVPELDAKRHLVFVERAQAA